MTKPALIVLDPIGLRSAGVWIQAALPLMV